jgi:2,3-dimethylmalate lyase
MVRKIAVAVEARTSPDFLIIARTDARTSKGLPEAIRRARAYAEAGADVLFIESPESEDELVTIGRELGDKLLMANMVEGGGRTPLLSNQRLAEIGFALAIRSRASSAPPRRWTPSTARSARQAHRSAQRRRYTRSRK